MLSIFKKAEIKEIMLPFRSVQLKEDEEAGIIGIEAYGNVLNETKYCYACYELKDKNMYNNGEYEQLIELLKNNGNKLVKVKFKIKNDKAKNFTIDISSLVEIYNDERFNNLELLGWGLNNKSVEE